MVQTTDAEGNAVELPHRPPQFKEFEAPAIVEQKNELTEGVVELVLRRADGEHWPTWAPGSHVDLILPDGLVRQYSLCGVVGDPNLWRLGILRETESRGGSAYVHDTLQAGDNVDVRGPRNAFDLRSHDEYIFIAGGIGITPIIPMINEVHGRGGNWTLHYGGRTRTSMAFVDELVATGGNVHLYPQDEVGFIPLKDILATPHQAVGVYACGPAPLLDAVDAFHETWPTGTVHMERFAVNAADLKHDDDKPIEVRLELSDLTIEVAADETILEVVERNGIGVLSSCREGTCGTCDTPVLEGLPDHRDSVLDDEDRELNDCMMICVSRALTPRLVLDL